MNFSRGRVTLGFILLLLFLSLYLYANRFSPYRPVPLPLTIVDKSIPFLPLSMWIYMSCYIFAPIIFFRLESEAVVRRYTYAYVPTILIACTIFWFFPTTFPRTALSLEGEDALTRWVFEHFWKLDAPQNCWPSLHVGVSYLAAFAAMDEAFSFKSMRVDGRTGEVEPAFTPRAAILSMIWATGIAVSTMSVRQHYFWDAAGGFALSGLAYGFVRWKFGAEEPVRVQSVVTQRSAT